MAEPTPPHAPDAVPPPAPRRARKLSMLALVAVLWAPLFFLMLWLSTVRVDVQLEPGEAAPMWQTLLRFVLLPLGWAAPIATTVLGLLALSRIRGSNGGQYGLSLALFAALLFPLLLLDALIFVVFWQVADSLVEQDVLGPRAAAAVFRQMLPTVVCVLADYLIVRVSWNALQPRNARSSRHRSP